MMQKRKNCLSVGLLVLLMGATGVLLLQDQPLSRLAGILGRIHGGFVALGLLLMLAFVGWAIRSPTGGAWGTPLRGSISAPSPPPPPGDSPPRSTICQKTTSPPPTGP